MTKSFTVGQKVIYTPSNGPAVVKPCDVRVSEVCTGQLAGMLVLKVYDGRHLVGTTCVSIAEVGII